MGPNLEKLTKTLQFHFDRSNFAIEIHQCFLDLVTAGTACLMLEESALGQPSAFQFTAVPLFDVVFEDSAGGRLDGTLRRMELTPRELKKRYPNAPSLGVENDASRHHDTVRINVIEAVIPDDHGYAYMAVAEATSGIVNEPTKLAEGRFESSPFINFRWLKAPGEIYGRSPVMKALPDIKTVNKVVELVLKNASISVTGIWQAEDDGVLNPANIKLVPGAIIPKAVGSKGLTALEAPGQFDTSNIILADMRNRIQRALMADKLGTTANGDMSATEVLERAAETARSLGATYGRLQSELLTPLVERAMSILRRRGEVPPVLIDGRTVDVDYKSPLARRQAKEDAQNILLWVNAVQSLGGNAQSIIDVTKTARWLARTFSVPDELLLPEGQSNPTPNTGGLNPDLIQQLTGLAKNIIQDQPSVQADQSLATAVAPLDSANAPPVPATPNVPGAGGLNGMVKGPGNVR